MRITAALVIALGLLAGLGFKVLHVADENPGANPGLSIQGLSIQDLHRDHPHMRSMPTDEVPLP